MEKGEKLITGVVVAAVGFSAVSSCSQNKANRDAANWEGTQGTQGFINLNDVRDAFRANESMVAFEERVNELFEGDNLIVFEAKEISGGFQLFAREDLDNSKSTSSKDDLLFTLSVKGRTATLKGAGINKYYTESWIYEPPEGAAVQVQDQSRRSSFTSSPFFWWWVLSPGWGGYYTPMSRYNNIYAHRTSYRTSSAYRSQTSRNSSFESSMSKKYGSSFKNSMNSKSAQRKSYIRSAPKSPGFKQKLAASKGKNGSAKKSQMRSSTRSSRSFSSSSRSSSSSKSYGGFRASSGFGI